MRRKTSGFSKASQGFSESEKQRKSSESEFRYGYHTNASHNREEAKKNAYRTAYDSQKREEENVRQREQQHYKEEFEQGKRWNWEYTHAPWEPVKETPLRVDFSEPPCTEAQYSYIVGICNEFGFKVPERYVSFRCADSFLNIWASRYKLENWRRMYREIYGNAQRTYSNNWYKQNGHAEDMHKAQQERFEYYQSLFQQGVITADEMSALLNELSKQRR